MQVDDPPLRASFLHLKGLIKNKMFERHLWEKQKRTVTLEAPVQMNKELCFALPMEDALISLAKAVQSSRPAIQVSADFSGSFYHLYWVSSQLRQKLKIL